MRGTHPTVGIPDPTSVPKAGLKTGPYYYYYSITYYYVQWAEWVSHRLTRVRYPNE
jgi:hypothetical protein